MSNYINGINIPMELFEKAEGLSKSAKIHRTDSFKIMNRLMPSQILNITKLKFPKSKNVMLQIDVRHIIRLK